MLSIRQNKAECELRAAYEQLAAAEEELKEQYTDLGRTPQCHPSAGTPVGNEYGEQGN